MREVLDLGKAALSDVHVAGAITIGRRGEQLAPIGEMADLGVRIFTDDGRGVQDDRLMRRALEYASGIGVTLAQHCEVESLSEGGHMHEGAWSSRLGIPGVPAEAEELMVMRDIALARLTDARVHFQHLSTAGSVELVRRAKAGGMPVTAEACPHHFTLTDAEVASYDPLFKVNPPLRTATDIAAIKDGLDDGTIDAIATDHAPHTQEVKEAPFDEAPCGMLGLETALALALTELDLPIERVLALMSWQPAAIAGLTRHTWRPDRRRFAGKPRGDRSRGHVGRRSLPAGEPQSQHAVRRPHARGPSAPHHPVGRTGCHRRRGAPLMGSGMTGSGMSVEEGLLVLADGTTFEGELVGADSAERHHHR